MFREEALKIITCLFLLCVSTLVKAEYKTVYDSASGLTWGYTPSGSTAVLGGGTYSTPAIVSGVPSFVLNIPSAVNGYSVNRISSYAFAYSNIGCGVNIYDNIKTIDNNAFSRSDLTSVNISSLYLEEIPQSCFSNCQQLRSVTLSKVKVLKSSSFYGCTSLKEINIPSSLTKIEANAFMGCSSLETFNASSISEIGSGAFINCYALSYFSFGGTLNSTFDPEWFNFCTNLTEVSIATADYQSKNFAVYNNDYTTLVMVPRGRAQYQFEESVTNIGAKAFMTCERITELSVPSRIASVGQWAFSAFGVTNLVFEGKPPRGLADSLIPQRTVIGYPAKYRDVWEYVLSDMEHPLAYSIGDDPARIQTVTNYVFVPVTNVVVHYVIDVDANLESKVVTEIRGGDIQIPMEWTSEYYAAFAAKFDPDITKAMLMKTGKTDANGHELYVWQDFVAGTDPTDETSVFQASVTMVEGSPVVSWTPELSAEQAALRKYTTYGKAKLQDAEWTVVNGDEANYNFFKVTVEMR